MIHRIVIAALALALTACSQTVVPLPHYDDTSQAAIPRYDRNRFGQPWADTDRNGCDTRNDTLRTQLTNVRVQPGTHGCVVTSGTLADPYSSAVITFRRGDRKVQIDHVVTLKLAWDAGAWRWDDVKRERFANDLANLRATRADLNEAKGDAGPSQWLPPSNAAEVCQYVRTWDTVVKTYALAPSQADTATVGEVLRGCR